MEAVLGIREDRTYETPALEAAKKRAKEYWAQAQKFGPVAIPPRIKAVLNQERHTNEKYFSMLVTMALSGPTEYTRNDHGPGTLVMVEEGGGRRWDQRSMAIAAQMSPNTARRCMKRLAELGLLVYEAVQGRCTYIRILNWGKFTRSKFCRAVLGGEPEKKRVSKSDTFLPPTTSSSPFTSTVDVPQTASRDKKEGDSLKFEVVDCPDGTTAIRWV